MKLVNAILVMMLAANLSGCESAEAKQHHLYNLQQCKAQVASDEPGAYDPMRVTQCMANTEHTTIEYQQAKGDDYHTEAIK
jgi:ABC-type uncharacterized transport system auxiliary subunit